jgi:hypothetical protein
MGSGHRVIGSSGEVKEGIRQSAVSIRPATICAVLLPILCSKTLLGRTPSADCLPTKDSAPESSEALVDDRFSLNYLRKRATSPVKNEPRPSSPSSGSGEAVCGNPLAF